MGTSYRTSPIAIEVVLPASLYRAMHAALDADPLLNVDDLIARALAGYLLERCLQKGNGDTL